MMVPFDLLGTPAEIRRELIKRRDMYIREKIPAARQSEFENNGEGWVLDKPLKAQVWMRKPKTHDVAFEDRVWAMCARMGFKVLSRDRNLRIPYGRLENQRKQVDVLAADDEVVLVFECKSSEAEQAPTHSFKSEVESISGYREGLIGALREQFPDHKVKFALAANNINITQGTLERIEGAGIAYVDEEAVDYYHELADHLGSAAKFQLLGNLFHGQQISAMDNTVPAIQGKMGGHVYYSFAIEPERLLKIAYVLHRTNANVRWMPTYQRIIKKSRLKKVSDFVEKGGFFPNSLIVNIDNNNKKLRFDRAESGVQSGSSTLGMLHLPRRYRSAYVIDGQHRLYGFANSLRGTSELVPVVAFVDLEGSKQLELFMQINENQQAVPKNLRNTLNADLLWDSPDKRKQAQALKLKVAQLLGELKSSPLRQRVIIGEEKSNDRRCISLDAVSRGIDRGRFIGEFTSGAIKRQGSFYRGSNDNTYKGLTEFLELCFGYLRDELPGQWNLGRADGGFVFTNAGVEAMLRLIGDVVDHLVGQGRTDPLQSAPKDVFVQVRQLLDYLVRHLDSLTPDAVAEYRGWLGSGAPTKYLRRFQAALAADVPDFAPDGLAEWIADQEKQFNADSYTMVREIEAHLRADIRRRLEDHFGADWFKEAVPLAIFQEGSARAAEKNWQADGDAHVDWWDCLYIIQYHKVLLHVGQAKWQEVFEGDYTLPSDEKSASWKSKSGWLNELNSIRNKVAHDGTVSEDEYEFLQMLHSHFGLGGTGSNG